ncbi:MAG TPA: hypothetical protein V6D05_13165, partial [Stenomitos sp.]
MTKHRLTLALIASLIGLQCAPAYGLPLESKWSLSASPVTVALDTELHLPGSPFGLSSRLGAAGFPSISASELAISGAGNWWTTWGHYTHALSPQSSIGGLVGLSQSWFFQGAPIPFRSWYNSVQPLVGFLGVFYQYDWGGTRLRLSPSVTFGNSGSGIPPLD